MASKPNPLVELWKRELEGMRTHANRRLAVADLTLDENDIIVPMGIVTAQCPCGSAMRADAEVFPEWRTKHFSHMGERVAITEVWHVPPAGDDE